MNFVSNEYKSPHNIIGNSAGYILNHTLVAVGTLSIDVVCGIQNIAQIWCDHFSNLNIQITEIDRIRSVPIACSVDWVFGSIIIDWSKFGVPDHEIVVSYEYRTFNYYEYITKANVNWIEEGF